jgi:hypothetical protein
MPSTAELNRLGARRELRSWYLDHLRPKLVESVTAGMLEPAALEQIDFELADLFDLPDDLDKETA